jgi:hypothetical protein
LGNKRVECRYNFVVYNFGYLYRQRHALYLAIWRRFGSCTARRPLSALNPHNRRMIG